MRKATRSAVPGGKHDLDEAENGCGVRGQIAPARQRFDVIVFDPQVHRRPA